MSENRTIRKTCRECGRPLPPVAVKHEDEFCSTVCAKKAHGVEWNARGRREAVQAVAKAG